jgi:pimeloyl-ACP methyl ester carboxylesterase
MRTAVLLLVFLLCLTLGAHSQTDSAPRLVKLEPCEVPGTEPDSKIKVLCGVHEVFEDRVSRTGRRIGLKIVVFPATGPTKNPDPFFYVPGGPGSSATEDAPYVAQEAARIRETRDLVFLDQRGTGGSNPLNCPFFNPADLQSYLGHWNPPDEVRECRKRLEQSANLKLYVTSIAIDDLDEVRAALGYRQINLFGASYGTRFAVTYIKRYGKNVRSAILHGVSPPYQYMPGAFPQHTQRALDGVLSECLADAKCAGAFPNIRTETAAVLKKLKQEPVEAEVKMTPDQKPTKVRLSRDLAGEAVRYMLYQSGSASRVPLVLHLAAQGNFAPLAEAAIFYRQVIVGPGANGMYLSVTCAEDLPWAKSDKRSDDTFLGDYRFRQQLEDCTLWPRGEIAKDYAKPARANVPVLIYTGQWDPVTPPLYGDMAAKTLPNSLHVVIPSGGHGFNGLQGLECVEKLSAEFVSRASVKTLDTSCVKGIRREGFALKAREPGN